MDREKVLRRLRFSHIAPSLEFSTDLQTRPVDASFDDVLEYKLTPQQQQFYDDNGYLVVRDLFTPEELAVWQDRFVDIVNGKVPPAKRMIVQREVMAAKGAVKVEDKEHATAKIQDFENDSVLFSYCTNPKLLTIVRGLIGDDVKSIHTMLINKPPGLDGRHPMHQDLLYFPFGPADDVCATWTAINHVDRSNGCLSVLPGSHRERLYKHGYPDWEYVNRGYFGVMDLGDRLEQRVHVEMEPGDTIFFHPQLIHGSGRNVSSGFRKAISAHYASAHCKFLRDEGLENHLAACPPDMHDLMRAFAYGARPYTLCCGHQPVGGDYI